MRIKYACWILAFALLLAAGCSKKSKKPAHLQFISMIPSHTASFSISAAGSGKQVNNKLDYAAPSGYMEFVPGKYHIRYTVQGLTVLDHTYILGPDSYQTLLAAGLWHDSLSVNPKTNSYTVKRIVAGAETADPNGFYPQFLMLRDKYNGGTSYGLVRLVHAAPFKKTLAVKNRGGTLASGLKYPVHTEPTPQKKALDLNFMMGSISLKRMTSSIDHGYLHTFIIGEHPNGEKPLTISTYKTATKSLRRKK